MSLFNEALIDAYCLNELKHLAFCLTTLLVANKTVKVTQKLHKGISFQKKKKENKINNSYVNKDVYHHSTKLYTTGDP